MHWFFRIIINLELPIAHCIKRGKFCENLSLNILQFLANFAFIWCNYILPCSNFELVKENFWFRSIFELWYPLRFFLANWLQSTLKLYDLLFLTYFEWKIYFYFVGLIGNFAKIICEPLRKDDESSNLSHLFQLLITPVLV